MGAKEQSRWQNTVIHKTTDEYRKVEKERQWTNGGRQTVTEWWL